MSTCGTGSWSGPLPGDPDNNVSLSAQTVFGGVRVAWSYPGTNPHAVAHVILYRGTTSNYAASTQLAIVNSNFYYDPNNTSNTYQYYYWMIVVSVNGTYGTVIGPATAQSNPVGQSLASELSAKIDSGYLAAALSSQISGIDALGTSISNEVTNRQTANTAMSGSITALASQVTTTATLVNTYASQRLTDNAAFASSVNVVAATAGTNLAAVETALTVDIDGLNNIVDAAYTAKVSVNGLVGGFGIHSNGLSVDAGFDTDTFWVGRTQANKVKPFIVSGSSTYIASAVIQDASITSAKIGNLQVKSANIEELTIGTTKITANAVTEISGGVLSTNSAQAVWGTALANHIAVLETGWVTATDGAVIVSVNLFVRTPSNDFGSENDSVTTVYPIRVYVVRVSGTYPHTWTTIFDEVGVYNFTIKDTPGLVCTYQIIPVITGGSYGVIKKGSSAVAMVGKK